MRTLNSLSVVLGSLSVLLSTSAVAEVALIKEMNSLTITDAKVGEVRPLDKAEGEHDLLRLHKGQIVIKKAELVKTGDGKVEIKTLDIEVKYEKGEGRSKRLNLDIPGDVKNPAYRFVLMAPKPVESFVNEPGRIAQWREVFRVQNPSDLKATGEEANGNLDRYFQTNPPKGFDGLQKALGDMALEDRVRISRPILAEVAQYIAEAEMSSGFTPRVNRIFPSRANVETVKSSSIKLGSDSYTLLADENYRETLPEELAASLKPGANLVFTAADVTKGLIQVVDKTLKDPKKTSTYELGEEGHSLFKPSAADLAEFKNSLDLKDDEKIDWNYGEMKVQLVQEQSLEKSQSASIEISVALAPEKGKAKTFTARYALGVTEGTAFSLQTVDGKKSESPFFNSSLRRILTIALFSNQQLADIKGKRFPQMSFALTDKVEGDGFGEERNVAKYLILSN